MGLKRIGMLFLGHRGRYTRIDFQMVMEAAKAELMSFAGKDALQPFRIRHPATKLRRASGGNRMVKNNL